MIRDICKHMKVGKECSECDEEFTISQAFPCAQSSAGNDQNDKNPKMDFKTAVTNSKKEFNDYLIMKNNRTNEDAGVHDGLVALDDPSQKAVKKLTKDKLVATLGFLNDKSFNEAKDYYKKVLVEDMKNLLLSEYKRLGPQSCDGCKIIFNEPATINKYEECFICIVKICPKCLPPDHGNKHKGLIPVCNECREIHKNKNGVEQNDGRKDMEENVEKDDVVEIKDSDKTDDDFTEVKKKTKKSKKDSDGASDDEKKTDGEKNEKAEIEKKDKVCIHYLMRKCKHGNKGDKCEWKHPKLCFSFMNKGKKGCEKEDCEYHHPDMCRYDTECKNEKCRFLHPRILKRWEKGECKYKEKCNKDDCKFKHTGRENKDKDAEKKKEEERVSETVTKRKTEVNVTKKIDDNNTKSVSQDFWEGRGEDPQIKELKIMMTELTKNVNLLMQERATYWNWENYYQH